MLHYQKVTKNCNELLLKSNCNWTIDFVTRYNFPHQSTTVKLNKQHSTTRGLSNSGLKLAVTQSVTFLCGQQSLLPLTDWKDAVSQADRLCCIQMLMLSVINWWPTTSTVYHTDCASKLTASWDNRRTVAKYSPEFEWKREYPLFF